MKSYILQRAVSRGARRTVSFGTRKSAASLSRSKSGVQKSASQRQLGQKPLATGRRRPVKGSPLWNRFNESRKCKYFTFVMTLLLLTGAIAMIILYFRKLKKLSEKANAMAAIRKFMIAHNQSLEGKSDAEILAGAQQLAKYLLDWKSQNDEVQKALDSAIEKLTQGWKRFRGHLYLFSTSILPLFDARQECQALGGDLIDITSVEEEDFVEAETYKSYAPYWIGLRNMNGNWKWLNGQPLTTHYWREGKPDNWGGLQEYCVEIQRCATKRKCWNDVPCSEKKKWICKLKPNPKWL